MTKVFFHAQGSRFVRVAAVAALAFVAQGSAAQQLTPIVYTLRAPQPASHVLQVEATVPTERRDSVDLMMAIWSPGYYRVEHYATRVRGFAARAADGTALRVTQPAPNRWRVFTAGRPSIGIAYEVLSQERSVTLNWVDDTLAVLNGAPTFITLAERAKRPHQVRLELAGLWKQSNTSLAAAPGGAPNHYIARDYDELVDSPIVAGNLRIRDFTVGSTRHVLASAGDVGAFDDARAARDLAVIVEAQRRFWGTLPYERYVFLNLFRRAGGGLEHLNSTLLTSNAARLATPRAYLGWLQFVSH
ncbi:MAG: M61 family metallopeptidase, partial [Gemmatimonadaceae bacterium]